MRAADGATPNNGCGRRGAAMTVMAGILVLFLLWFGGQEARAAEQDGRQEETPSKEMLEFLGEGQSGDGVWFDPTVKETGPESPQGTEQEHNHD